MGDQQLHSPKLDDDEDLVKPSSQPQSSQKFVVEQNQSKENKEITNNNKSNAIANTESDFNLTTITSSSNNLVLLDSIQTSQISSNSNAPKKQTSSNKSKNKSNESTIENSSGIRSSFQSNENNSVIVVDLENNTGNQTNMNGGTNTNTNTPSSKSKSNNNNNNIPKSPNPPSSSSSGKQTTSSINLSSLPTSNSVITISEIGGVGENPTSNSSNKRKTNSDQSSLEQNESSKRQKITETDLTSTTINGENSMSLDLPSGKKTNESNGKDQKQQEILSDSDILKDIGVNLDKPPKQIQTITIPSSPPVLSQNAIIQTSIIEQSTNFNANNNNIGNISKEHANNNLHTPTLSSMFQTPQKPKTTTTTTTTNHNSQSHSQEVIYSPNTCQICGKRSDHFMTLDAFNMHVNQCLDGKSSPEKVDTNTSGIEACCICGKDITTFTLDRRQLHLEKCVQKMLEKADLPVEYKILDSNSNYLCPSCGKELTGTPKTKINHLKLCSKNSKKQTSSYFDKSKTGTATMKKPRKQSKKKVGSDEVLEILNTPKTTRETTTSKTNIAHTTTTSTTTANSLSSSLMAPSALGKKLNLTKEISAPTSPPVVNLTEISSKQKEKEKEKEKEKPKQPVQSEEEESIPSTPQFSESLLSKRLASNTSSTTNSLLLHQRQAAEVWISSSQLPPKSKNGKDSQEESADEMFVDRKNKPKISVVEKKTNTNTIENQNQNNNNNNNEDISFGGLFSNTKTQTNSNHHSTPLKSTTTTSTTTNSTTTSPTNKHDEFIRNQCAQVASEFTRQIKQLKDEWMRETAILDNRYHAKIGKLMLEREQSVNDLLKSKFPNKFSGDSMFVFDVYSNTNQQHQPNPQPQQNEDSQSTIFSEDGNNNLKKVDSQTEDSQDQE